MIDKDLPLIEFSAFDRCDGCGARALSSARRDDMPQELLFCIHHRMKHINALLDEGWEIVDGTEALEILGELAGAERIPV